MFGSYRRFKERTVRVHTAQSSVEGVLVHVSFDFLHLKAAKQITAENEVPLTGEVAVPRESVDFLQVLG